jgi:hypothetical protein
VCFQNTGTLPALRVVISDTLSADLQWATMQEIASSHDHTWTIQDGVLRFVFDNIDLPDSSTDEPGSHGFVKFSMKPASDLMVGESVGNTANIFFDYNEPVTTNEAVFSVEASTGMGAIAMGGLVIWPNPVSDVLVLSGAPIGSTVEIVDVTGRALLRSLIENERTAIDTKELSAGMYTLRLQGSTTLARSFVKR